MYLIRRVFIVKPQTTREAAQIITQVGEAYEKVGRSPTRVYWSGYTVPGPANTVYMDWTQETLGSPYDHDAKAPEGLGTIYDRLTELCDDSYVEFYEMV